MFIYLMVQKKMNLISTKETNKQSLNTNTFILLNIKIKRE